MHVILRRYANPGYEERERERLSQRFDKRGEETGFSMIIRSCTHRNSIIDTNSISRHLFVTFIDSKPVRLGLDHLSRSIRSYASCHPSCPWSSIVFRLLAIDKRRLRQFTKTIPPPPLSLLPLLFKCRINLLSFQQSSLIINETHSNSWHEINFERLIIYTWSSLIIRGEWTGGSFHRLTVLPDFASLIFIFYGQAVFKNSHAYEFDIKCFSLIERRWSMEKRVDRREFVNSISPIFTTCYYTFKCKIYKRWPRWNPSNYRTIKLTMPLKFINLKYKIDRSNIWYL